MKMSKRIAAIALARRQISDAEIYLDKVTKEHFPIGAAITWRIGVCSNPLQSGTVINHGWQDRLKVRNAKTGKERWIRSYDMAWV